MIISKLTWAKVTIEHAELHPSANGKIQVFRDAELTFGRAGQQTELRIEDVIGFALVGQAELVRLNPCRAEFKGNRLDRLPVAGKPNPVRVFCEFEDRQ